MTSILEQARQEGRQQQRETQVQIAVVQAEDVYEVGQIQGRHQAEAENRKWCGFYFLLGVSLTVLFYELVIYP